MKSSVKSPPAFFSLPRCAGVCVALVELIYLVFWMGQDLGLLDSAPFFQNLNAPQGTLTQLVEGMIWAAAIGAAGGLLAAIVVHLTCLAVGRWVRSDGGQAFARLLRVRNQTR